MWTSNVPSGASPRHRSKVGTNSLLVYLHVRRGVMTPFQLVCGHCDGAPRTQSFNFIFALFTVLCNLHMLGKIHCRPCKCCKRRLQLSSFPFCVSWNAYGHRVLVRTCSMCFILPPCSICTPDTFDHLSSIRYHGEALGGRRSISKRILVHKCLLPHGVLHS